MHQEPANPIQIFGILDINYIQGHVFSSPVYGGQFFFWEPANGRLFCQLKHLFYYKDHHVSEPTLVTRICGPRRIVFPSIFWTRSVTLTYPSPRAWDFSFTGCLWLLSAEPGSMILGIHGGCCRIGVAVSCKDWKFSWQYIWYGHW